jgi:hypothetical protein
MSIRHFLIMSTFLLVTTSLLATLSESPPMAPARKLPLLSFTSTDVLPTTPQEDCYSDAYDDCAAPKKSWSDYLPLCGEYYLTLSSST